MLYLFMWFLACGLRTCRCLSHMNRVMQWCQDPNGLTCPGVEAKEIVVCSVAIRVMHGFCFLFSWFCHDFHLLSESFHDFESR